MIHIDASSFLLPTKKFRRLTVLLSIYNAANISQHKIAARTKMSSAMVNSYIKELVKTNNISIVNRNNRDREYIISKSGKKELTSLLIGYSAEIVQLYSQIKAEIAARITGVINGNRKAKIVLYGASTTCELVLQVLKEFSGARVIGIVDSDPDKQHSFFNEFSVLAPEAIPSLAPDYILITSFARQDEIFEHIEGSFDPAIKIIKLSTV